MFISFALKPSFKVSSLLTRYCSSRLFLDTIVSATAGVLAISGIVADAAFLSAITRVADDFVVFSVSLPFLLLSLLPMVPIYLILLVPLLVLASLLLVVTYLLLACQLWLWSLPLLVPLLDGADVSPRC